MEGMVPVHHHYPFMSMHVPAQHPMPFISYSRLCTHSGLRCKGVTGVQESIGCREGFSVYERSGSDVP